jgi:hypothetical protein
MDGCSADKKPERVWVGHVNSIGDTTIEKSLQHDAEQVSILCQGWGGRSDTAEI